MIFNPRDILYALAAAAISFLFLAILFRPLELAFPAKPNQKFLRPHFFTDLLFFLGQYLLWTSLVFFLLVHFAQYLDTIIPQPFRHRVAAQPLWIQALEVIFLSDFFIYWGHRLQHTAPILWRFHAIHHSAEHLDWLAAHREHPIDTIYTVGLINLPAFLLGFPLETLTALIAFRGIWAIYIHSNVRLPIPFLRWFIGAPELHHWHHDRNQNAGNYANISPIMDLLFGTYICPNHEPTSLGLRDPIPQNYFLQLLHPFLPKKSNQPNLTAPSTKNSPVPSPSPSLESSPEPASLTASHSAMIANHEVVLESNST